MIRFHLRLLLALLALLLTSQAQAVAETTLSVSLVLPPGADHLEAQLRVMRSGQEHRVPMQKAGTLHRVAELELPETRLLQLAIWLKRPDQDHAEQAYANIEQMTPGRNLLAFTMERGEPPLARRVSTPQDDSFFGQDRDEAWILGLSLCWNLAVLGIVLWLAWRSRRSRGPRPSVRPASLAGELGLLLLWVALAVAFTWPAALAGGELMVGRHYDLPGSLWTLGAADRLFPDLQDPLTAFPVGASYIRLDSYTLLPFGLLSRWIDPATIHGWLQILGIASMAWAAERFALATGARRPWTLLAGLSLAFSGMSANVLLEGHVYHVMNPWLPLFGWTWWRATTPSGRWYHGALAGLFFFGTLMTTAYLALVAATMAVVFFAAGLLSGRQHRPPWVPTAAAVVTVLLLSLPYTAAFVLLGESRSTGGVTEVLMETGTNLTGLASPGAELDRGRRSKGLALSGVTLALFAVAPMLLGRQRNWRRLAAAAGLLLLMAFGTAFGPNDGTVWFPMPMKLLQGLGAGLFLRFPLRFAWGWLVCAGIVAAWAGTHLERRVGRFARVLLLAAVLEPFLMVRLPWRQAAPLHDTPDAYQDTEGPVLDLFPDGSEPPVGIGFQFSRLACYYQNSHGQAISDDCIATRYDDNPSYVLNRWLISKLLEGQHEQAFTTLEQLGFAAVVIHADLFQPGDLLRIQDGLEASGRPLTARDGGGEWLQLLALQPEPASDPAALMATIEWAPPSSIGDPAQPAYPEVHTLRLELILPQDPVYLDLDNANYMARMLDEQGEPVEVMLRQDGMAPQDSADDFTLVGYPDRPVPGHNVLSVLRVEGDGEQVVWSGPVRLKLAEDALTFRLRAEDTEQRAWPVAAAPIVFSPPADFWNGRVASAGWAAYLLLLGGFWALVLARRRQEAS